MDCNLGIYCVADLSQPPKKLRAESGMSYSVQLDKWPEHLVMFAVGDWSSFDRYARLSAVLNKVGASSDTPLAEDAGTLSLQKPVLHHTSQLFSSSDVNTTTGQIKITVSCDPLSIRPSVRQSSLCYSRVELRPQTVGQSTESATGCVSTPSKSSQSPEPENCLSEPTSPISPPPEDLPHLACSPRVSVCTPTRQSSTEGVLSPPDSDCGRTRSRREFSADDVTEKSLEMDDDWPPSTQPDRLLSSPSQRARLTVEHATPKVPAAVLSPPATAEPSARADSVTEATQDRSSQKRKRQGGRGSAKKLKKVLSFSAAEHPSEETSQVSKVVAEISARWGHTTCLLRECSLLVLGGQAKSKISTDSCLELDVTGGKPSFTTLEANGGHPERRTGHSAVLDPNSRTLFVYGGSKNKRWFSDVHALDLDTKQWQQLQATGQAPTRSYHSCTYFRGELYVFGGNFPNPDPQPDGCSNDLFIFDPSQLNWYKPLVTGEKPQPRSGHSASLVDNRIVLFGGWDYPTVFNDLFVLDLVLMEFSRPKTAGVPPSPRSWHASCVLPDNRVFIHGGYDGNIALNDAFVFDLERLAWLSVRLPKTLSDLPARAGHTAACTTDGEELVVICGGGDNCGLFFKDTVCVEVSAIESGLSEA